MSIFELDDDTYEVNQTQYRIIEFIVDFGLAKGYQPTIREIASGTSIHTISVVQFHINRLVNAGVLLRETGMSRTIRLSPEGEDWYELNKE